MHRYLKLLGTFSVLLLAVVLLFSTRLARVATSTTLRPQEGGVTLYVSEEVKPGLSRPVSELPTVEPAPLKLDREINPRQNKSTFLQGPVDLPNGGPDPLLDRSNNNGANTPGLILSFDGISYATGGSGSPPDTNGDVGPNHYVQMVNSTFSIFNKSGALLAGPTAINQLWGGAGTRCGTRNDGDPVVVYDQMADRWLLSQFVSASPYYICVAISQTANPQGAYYTYDFSVTELPDYFKFGAWPDAYYMSSNESTYGAYAFNRTRMLQGLSATYVKFTGQTNFLMPADVDGPTAPPANAAGTFYTFKDNSYSGHGGGVDRLEVFQLVPDFTTPANSTFTLVSTIPVSSYTYTVCGFFVMNCIPQQGTTAKLDPLSEWPMFRLAYRNFGSYEALAGNFTVDVGSDRAGIRWFELRRSGGAWSLYQEGTQAPGAEHRWVGSIAMDRNGNIALGYSVSSSSMYPAIRYATRLGTDTLGTLQTEATLLAGTGSQTATHNRWGDYADMTVDPTDDCTFWFTTEYFSTSGSSWKTRIGSFKMAECTSGPTPTPGPTSTATPTATVTPTPLPTTCTTFASSDVPKTISASGTPTVSSVLAVSGSGAISDINVLGLNGTHTWINDLDFNLQSPLGTLVQIMARSCSSEDNFNLNLDDEAAAGSWPCPPIGGGTYRPSNALSAFDGQNANGAWTLIIHDNANLDGGSLSGWSLQICVPMSQTPTATPTSAPPTATPTTAPPTATPTTAPPTATWTPTTEPPTATPTTPPGSTGFLSPASNAAETGGDNNGFEVSPTNAYADDGLFAVDNNSGTGTATSCGNGKKDRQRFYTYGVSLPGGATVKGIEVRLDAKVDSTSGSPKFCVQLSWDGGVSWTAAKSTTTLTTAEASYVLGGATDTWGHTWTTTDLNNTNLRVRIISVAASTVRDFSLDWAALRVSY